MDIQEIQTRIDAIRAAMTAKGLAGAEATAMVRSDRTPGVHLAWKDETAEFGRKYHSVSGDNLGDALRNADAFIAALPSPEEAKLHEFMGALGKVIDLGRSRGVDVEFVNPLVATMKRLSENVITDQRAA